MEKIRAAVVGYGNIGRYVVETLRVSPDFEIAGIIRRNGSENCPDEIKDLNVVKDVKELGKVDVAILCTPTRKVEEHAIPLLEMGINTVDSFDIHTNILLEAIAPKGITYTNFGPGMSMGHTVAVKAIEGVKAALSMTIPTGTGVHRRMVYIEVKEGYDFDKVAAAIKADPYFAHDETHVIKVDDVDALIDMGHGVNLTRKGVSGQTQNQLFEFDMKINNPALTAQVMVCSARASFRQKSGCYTVPADLKSAGTIYYLRKP